MNWVNSAQILAKANMTDTDKSAALIGEAIKSKDTAKFDLAFSQMTAGCNSCHQAADRDFILNSGADARDPI
jgi:hypothetical protein